jgi:peptidyl-prolyl cis-trans isomerase A (cyclophilin A)
MHSWSSEQSPKFLIAFLIVVSLSSLTAPAARAETHPKILMQTSLGEIVFELYPDQAPISAGNFLDYVDENLFGGAHFYRVVTMENQPDNDVKIEVIQGGLGFAAEDKKPPIEHETTSTTGIKHLDGALSMARLGPGTATSEFFVCVGDQPELDFGGARNPDGQGFAAFGRVIEGMDVVRAIHQGEANGQMLIETVAITRILRVPD